jgi:hypothetical protein
MEISEIFVNRFTVPEHIRKTNILPSLVVPVTIMRRMIVTSLDLQSMKSSSPLNRLYLRALSRFPVTIFDSASNTVSSFVFPYRHIETPVPLLSAAYTGLNKFVKFPLTFPSIDQGMIVPGHPDAFPSPVRARGVLTRHFRPPLDDPSLISLPRPISRRFDSPPRPYLDRRELLSVHPIRISHTTQRWSIPTQ